MGSTMVELDLHSVVMDNGKTKITSVDPSSSREGVFTENRDSCKHHRMMRLFPAGTRRANVVWRLMMKFSTTEQHHISKVSTRDTAFNSKPNTHSADPWFTLSR